MKTDASLQRNAVFLQTTILALLGGSLLYYILFGGSGGGQKKRRNAAKGGPGGLNNPGNLCYVNAVFQALASCEKGFLPWIQSRTNEAFSEALYAFLCSINAGNTSLSGFKGIMSCLRARGWVLDPREQDAHELFNVFLTTLEEEGEEEVSRTHRRRLSLNQALDFNSLGSSSNLSSQHPFSGTFVNKLIKPSSPQISPASSNSFNNVTLTLPSNRVTRISLQSLLDSFTSEEEVSSGAFKRVTFGKLPNCVCFHVQRTAFIDGVPSKRTEKVQFPQILDMAPYSYGYARNKEFRQGRHSSVPPERSFGSSEKFSSLYLLRAVIQHSGAVNSGHYVTYRCLKGKWYFTSDSHVEKVEFTDVLAANPYMLFYEREIA